MSVNARLYEYFSSQQNTLKEIVGKYVRGAGHDAVMHHDVVVDMMNMYFRKIIDVQVDKVYDSGGKLPQPDDINNECSLTKTICNTFSDILINIDPESYIYRSKDNINKQYILDRIFKWCADSHNNCLQPSRDEQGNYIYISPDDLARISTTILNPQFRADIDRDIRLRSQQKIEVKYTAMYTCPGNGCGARKADTWHIQTRSLDEDNTLFAKCLECGTTWTIKQ